MSGKLESAMSTPPGCQPEQNAPQPPEAKCAKAAASGERHPGPPRQAPYPRPKAQCACGVEARGILFLPGLGLGLSSGKSSWHRLRLRLRQLSFASGLGWRLGNPFLPQAVEWCRCRPLCPCPYCSTLLQHSNANCSILNYCHNAIAFWPPQCNEYLSSINPQDITTRCITGMRALCACGKLERTINWP